jgi:hypothetical protein
MHTLTSVIQTLRHEAFTGKFKLFYKEKQPTYCSHLQIPMILVSELYTFIVQHTKE